MNMRIPLLYDPVFALPEHVGAPPAPPAEAAAPPAPAAGAIAPAGPRGPLEPPTSTVWTRWMAPRRGELESMAAQRDAALQACAEATAALRSATATAARAENSAEARCDASAHERDSLRTSLAGALAANERLGQRLDGLQARMDAQQGDLRAARHALDAERGLFEQRQASLVPREPDATGCFHVEVGGADFALPKHAVEAHESIFRSVFTLGMGDVHEGVYRCSFPLLTTDDMKRVAQFYHGDLPESFSSLDSAHLQKVARALHLDAMERYVAERTVDVGSAILQHLGGLQERLLARLEATLTAHQEAMQARPLRWEVSRFTVDEAEQGLPEEWEPFGAMPGQYAPNTVLCRRPAPNA